MKRLHAALTFACALASVAVAGCRHKLAVGGGYTIEADANLDNQYHGNTLYFQGHPVHDDVKMQIYHDGMLVFMSGIPASGDEQLVVVRGVGPVVVLSARLLGQPFHGSRTEYRLYDLQPTADGVRAVFYLGVDDNTGAELKREQVATWTQIRSWLDEAENLPVKQAGHRGDYRVLPPAPVATNP